MHRLDSSLCNPHKVSFSETCAVLDEYSGLWRDDMDHGMSLESYLYGDGKRDFAMEYDPEEVRLYLVLSSKLPASFSDHVPSFPGYADTPV